MGNQISDDDNNNYYNVNKAEVRNERKEPKYRNYLKARPAFLDANQKKAGCSEVNDTLHVTLREQDRMVSEPQLLQIVFRSNFSSEGFQRIILSWIINWENISRGL